MPPTAPPGWPRRRELLFWLLAAAYMGLLFWLSSSPRPPLPPPLWTLGDKLLHALGYLPLGALWRLAIAHRMRHPGVWAWGAAALFGLSDELHQGLVPGREPSVGDWLADALGAAAGVALASRWFFSGRREKKRFRP